MEELCHADAMSAIRCFSRIRDQEEAFPPLAAIHASDHKT
jgi:hypothetical protein